MISPVKSKASKEAKPGSSKNLTDSIGSLLFAKIAVGRRPIGRTLRHLLGTLKTPNIDIGNKKYTKEETPS